MSKDTDTDRYWHFQSEPEHLSICPFVNLWPSSYWSDWSHLPEVSDRNITTSLTVSSWHIVSVCVVTEQCVCWAMWGRVVVVDVRLTPRITCTVVTEPSWHIIRNCHTLRAKFAFEPSQHFHHHHHRSLPSRHSSSVCSHNSPGLTHQALLILCSA
jgi:hypothetical protein